MAIAYFLLLLGANGDIDYHLRRAFSPANTAPVIMLPLGNVLYGIWLFGFYARRKKNLSTNSHETEVSVLAKF